MNVASEQGGSALHGSARTRASIALLFATMGAGAASCTLVVDPDATQCKTDGDCQKRFGETSDLFCREQVCVAPSCSTDDDCKTFGEKYADTVCREAMCEKKSNEPPEWLCLDEAVPPMTMPGPYELKARASDIVSMKPVVNATVKLCSKLDATCSTPTATATTDADGRFTVSLATSFSGFVSIASEGMLTTDYFVNPAVTANTDLGTVQMAVRNTARLLAGAGGAELLDDRGIVFVSTQDCLKKAAAGIQFSSADADATTTPFYAIGGLPSKTATETDTAGFGGFINVKPGYFTVEGKRASDGRPIGRFGIQVRSADSLVIMRLPATKL